MLRSVRVGEDEEQCTGTEELRCRLLWMVSFVTRVGGIIGLGKRDTYQMG